MLDPILGTQHLVALDGENKPATGENSGIGSGCLLRIGEDLVLLGVRHVTCNKKVWGLNIEYVPGRGSKLYRLGSPTFFLHIEINALPLPPKIADLDFFVYPIELADLPKHQEWLAPDVCSRDEPKRIFTERDLTEPTKKQEYEFAGLVLPEVIQGPHKHAFFGITPIQQTGLKLKADEGLRLVFDLPHTHPGHEWYQGASGAPVVDNKGKLVALLMGGCDQTNSIFAFPVKRHFATILATLAVDKGSKKFRPQWHRTPDLI